MNLSTLLAPSGIATLEFDATSLQQLDPCAPTYWLYPGPVQFHPANTPVEITRNFLQAAQRASRSSRGSQSSATLCLHWAGVPVDQQARYLALLCEEIGLHGNLLGKLFQIDQLQLRGGMAPGANVPPLLAEVRQHFLFSPNCQYQIAIDVNPGTAADLHVLRESGFSHLHLTLRDHGHCARDAQRAAQVIARARELCFASIAVTLDYGLPQLTMLSLARLLKHVIEARPDRISLRANQRTDTTSSTRTGNGLHAQLYWCLKHLRAAQYHYLGSYVFAKTHDRLARAQSQGRLHRNLYGYAAQNEHNHIGCGLGAVSCLGNFYAQNHNDLAGYQQQLQAGQLPLMQELHLSMDDLLRRIIIHMLLCNFELSIEALELSYPINFRQYFAHEWQQLQSMEQQRWLTLDDNWLMVQARGRLFIDQICAIFDHYPHPAEQG